ncbi:MAG: nuclear transport factor 2 family protein [Thermoleophilaceae bacterium]
MSQENVDASRWLVEKFNARDLTAFASKLHEDVEWVPALIPMVEAGSESEFRGIEGFWRWIAATDEVMAEFRVEAEAYHDVGDDRVLLLGLVVGRGRASGAPFRADLGQVLTFRDGRVVSYRGYLHRADALEAVGLRE